MLNEVIPGMVYKNKKNGMFYFVQDIGLHTELKEMTVHYVPLYPAGYKHYYRPLELFKNKFVEATELMVPQEDLDTWVEETLKRMDKE